MRLTALPLLVFAALAACSSPGSDPATMPNFASPLAKVYTAGQPSESQLAALPTLGITRVVGLRRADEKGTGWEEDRAKEIGIEYVRIPINSKTDLTRANAERLAAELAKSGDTGTLVCCRSSDRVGALFALKAFWLDGKTKDEALALGKAAGLNKLAPAVAAKMQ